MEDLFGFVSRDERQALCLHKWKEAKGHGTIEACTGFGKTRVATNLIVKLLSKQPSLRVLIVVPTITLKDQWVEIIDTLGYAFNCEVVVINTAITRTYKVDLLIIDEVHRCGSDTFQDIFKVVKYKWILCLTATLERLDGREEIIKKYAPICDSIPLELALFNHWVSEYKEYEVIIEVDDIDTYYQYDREFQEHFEFFGRNFDLIMNKTTGLLGKNGLTNRLKLRDTMCPAQYDYKGNLINIEDRKQMLRDITYHATAFNRAMQARKTFIYNHPKKLEVVRKIIEARSDKKIITFAKSVKMAEAVGIGKVYSGKDSKKRSKNTIDEFKEGKFNVLNTIEKVNEG